MRITLKTTALTLDVDVTVVDPAVRLGDVYHAITGQTAGKTIMVDGWPYRPGEAVGGIPLRSGSVIADGALGHVEPKAVLTQIAGRDTGRAVELEAGIFDIARSDGRVSDGLFRIEVDPATPASAPLVRPLATSNLWLDDKPARGEGAREAKTIRTAVEAFRLDLPHETRPPAFPMVDAAAVQFHRSPRLLLDEPIEQPAKPDRPQAPSPPQPFSWLLALAPIPVGLVVAVLFSPFFLVFALMSPILSGARWFDGKRKSNRALAEYRTERQRVVDEYLASMEQWGADETVRRRSTSPDLVELTARVANRSSGMWERRAEHSDFLHVVVGLGDVYVDSNESDFAEIQKVCDDLSVLRAVPIAVDLRTDGALGIVGPAAQRRAAAETIIAELAINHGPADLAIVLLLAPDRVVSWDWAKWLPHLEDHQGFRAVISDTTHASAVLSGMARPEPANGTRTVPLVSPTPVVVVDGDDYLGGGFTALSAAVRSGAARAVVLADRLEDLPAICTRVLSLDEETQLIAMERARVDRNLMPRLLAADLKAEVCRGLAAYADPERLDASSALPQTCSLKSLATVEVSTEGLVESWAAAPSDPTAVIGVAPYGPMSINLVTDGPHALLAGTTGSGKSELLRTLVASLAITQSPDRLNFVLIDFKGGGAFDACESLPHTVGVVTDLDEALAARALRCLKAELKYREHRLRDAGVSDLRDYEAEGEPLPRLVVVVDEFATLAAELPEFMASLIDVAQRGRSLGIHMILATQRPAGVIDAKIRANTNLRVSLRVQDEADSVDVLGDKRAASIDRRSPGRGFARLGASDLTEFQAAIVSERTDETVAVPLRVTTFELRNTGPASVAAPLSADGSNDLEELVGAAHGAVTKLGIAPPRIPWPEALPKRVEAADLLTTAPSGRWSVPMGMVDRPDEQRTEVYRWTSEVGNLAVYGTDAGSTSAVVASLVLGLASGHRPDEAHAYIVDFSGGGALSGLAKLSHVAAIVTAQDEERLIRIIDRLDAELATRGADARSRGLAQIGPEDGFPIVILAVANYGALMAYLEEANKFELAARFERFVRDGPPLGLFVVATANQDRAIPARVAGQIESKLIMRLADPNAYAAFGLRAKEVPDMGHCRAIDIRTGLDVQLAEYPACAADELALTSADDQRGTAGPERIRVLESEIAAEGLVEQSSVSRGGLTLAIGRRHADLDAAKIQLQAGTNLVVTGGAGSGKTTALRAIALAARHADETCSVVAISDDRDGWPNAAAELSEDLIDPSRRTLLILDGIAGVDEEQGRVLERLASEANLWIALAERPELLLAPPMWFRRFSASRSGLLLRPQNDHGEILRARLPPRGPALIEPGRGYLVNAGAVELVQIANVKTMCTS